MQYCHANIENNYGIIISLFLSGFFGGFSHCIFMCGSFAVGQVCAKLSNIPIDKSSNFTKIKESILLPYHLGRMTVYTILGIFSVTLGHIITNLSNMRLLSSMFLMLAGMMFIAYGCRTFGWIKFSFKWNSALSARIAALVAQFSSDATGVKGYLLGCLLGFLPCGLVYSALIAVASVGKITTAILAMMAFTMGTIPSLLIISCGCNIIVLNRIKSFIVKISRFVLLANGMVLVIWAMKMILN